MPNLLVRYSQEIREKLTKTAVVLPGTSVRPGDVIHFPAGRHGDLLFSRLDPLGSFTVRTDLHHLGLEPEMVADDGHMTYVYASSDGTSLDFGGSGGDPTVAGGSLRIRFTRQGSIYIAAVGCQTQRLADPSGVKVSVTDHAGGLIWNDTYLVTAVTTASRALVMQAASSRSELSVKGQVLGLQPGSPQSLMPEASLEVTGYSDSSFIVPWTEAVTLFFDVERFSPETFGAKAAVARERVD